jgi:hypothetical protein
MGFQTPSPFSTVQAYSHIPHPMHLLGSTATNFLGWVLADICGYQTFSVLKYHCASLAFNRYPRKTIFLWKATIK